MMMLNLDSWWDEPAYEEAQETFSERGAFILSKLRSVDAEKLDTVLNDIYRDGTPDPMDITKFEWQVILAYVGAGEEEIADVQKKR